MKIKFCILTLIVFSCSMFSPNVSNAQFKKLKGAIKKTLGGDKSTAKDSKETAEPVSPYCAPNPNSYSDETGISGTYYALEAIMDVKDKKQKVYQWQFVREENDDIVNKLNLYYHPTENYKWDAKLSEKKTKLAGINIFYSNDYHEVFGRGKSSAYDGGYIIELEKEVYAFYDLNIESVIEVMVKDTAMFEVYDKEVAQAKCEQILKNIKKAELDVTRKKLMSYKAYKEYIGKTIFVDNYTKVSYQYSDKPTEDPAVFLTTHEMGKYLYHRSYFDMPISYVCGDDCQYNFVFEMDGIITDRIKQRKVSSGWSKNISKKRADKSFVSSAHTLMDGRVWDYTFIYCLYQNKDKFKVGQSYKLNVKIYANKDGQNGDLLAEGNINLKYTDNSVKSMGSIFQKFEDFLSEQ